MSKITELKKNIADEYYQKSYSATLNPEENGGEAVSITVDCYDNGDGEDSKYQNITIEANCYGIHSSSITMFTVGINELAEITRLISGMINEKAIELIPVVKPEIIDFVEDQPITERVEMCQNWKCQVWKGDIGYAPRLVINDRGYRICPQCNISR